MHTQLKSIGLRFTTMAEWLRLFHLILPNLALALPQPTLHLHGEMKPLMSLKRMDTGSGMRRIIIGTAMNYLRPYAGIKRWTLHGKPERSRGLYCLTRMIFTALGLSYSNSRMELS